MADFFEPNQSVSTQNTTVQPWMQAAPYLSSMYGMAQSLYGQGLPQQWTGSVNAPLSAQTNRGMDWLSQIAGQQQGSQQLPGAMNAASGIAQGQNLGGGNAFLQNLLYGGGGNGAQGYAQGLQGQFGTNPALGMLTNTAGGANVGSNPYLQGMSNAATQTMTDQFKNATMPGIESVFSQGGRYGGHEGGALATQQNVAANQLGTNLGNMNSQIYGNAYQQDMQRQLAAQQSLGQIGLGMQQNQLGLGGLLGTLQGQNIGAAQTLNQGQVGVAGTQLAGAQTLPGLMNAQYIPGQQMMGMGTGTMDPRAQADLQNQIKNYVYQGGTGQWGLLNQLGNLYFNNPGSRMTSTDQTMTTPSASDFQQALSAAGQVASIVGKFTGGGQKG
jgi:hypothetical protein